MSRANKIIALFIAMSSLAVVSTPAGAKAKKVRKANTAKETVVGFHAGRELLFNSSPLVHNRQAKVHTGVSNSLVLRKPINTHFALEGGISYSSFRNIYSVPNTGDNTIGKPYNTLQRACNVAMPITVNYSMLPHHCCIHPYIGAGFQYNLNLNNKNNSPFTSDSYLPVNNQPGTGIKYINILFTQGVIFQVNTSIEINQSFHFIPCANNRVVGIDLGIGYHFP